MQGSGGIRGGHAAQIRYPDTQNALQSFVVVLLLALLFRLVLWCVDHRSSFFFLSLSFSLYLILIIQSFSPS